MSEEELADLDDDAKAALQNGEVKALEHEAGEETEDDYGERVRKRIGKEVSRRKALESERDQERAERERVQRERDEAMARLSKYEARQDEDLKSKADDLKTRRDKALDEGDLAEYNRLNDELMDTRIELRDRSTRRPAKADDEGGGEQQRQTQQPAASGAGSEWVARNKAWLQADEANVALAKGIEAKLVRKHGGYTDELYRELSKRLAAVSEDFIDDDGDDLGGDFDERPTRSTTVGVPRESSDDGQQRRRSGGKLTRDDLTTMSRYGMDPNSPKDRKAWLNRNAEL
ncbi:MAG: hypothetical protein KIS75_10675 [Chromatiales bacterium]|nr:hypothetical protein [Chromatiales bacterium]